MQSKAFSSMGFHVIFIKLKKMAFYVRVLILECFLW